MLVELGRVRAQLDQPSALARPGRRDLAATGSIWPPLAPLLARFACSAHSWALQLARFGCPTSVPSTRLAKKSICLSTIHLRCCLLRALWNVSSCLKSSNSMFKIRSRIQVWVPETSVEGFCGRFCGTFPEGFPWKERNGTDTWPQPPASAYDHRP